MSKKQKAPFDRKATLLNALNHPSINDVDVSVLMRRTQSVKGIQVMYNNRLFLETAKGAAIVTIKHLGDGYELVYWHADDDTLESAQRWGYGICRDGSAFDRVRQFIVRRFTPEELGHEYGTDLLSQADRVLNELRMRIIHPGVD